MPKEKDTIAQTENQCDSDDLGNFGREALALLRSIDSSLKRMADARRGDKKWEDRAIQKLDEIGPNVRKIAIAVGVHRDTLYSNDRFVKALKEHRLRNAGVIVSRRGFRLDDGDITVCHEDDEY